MKMQLVVVAGLCVPVMAQGSMSLQSLGGLPGETGEAEFFSLGASATVVEPGETVTVSMSWTSNLDRVLAGGIFEFIADAGTPEPGEWLFPGEFAEPGVVDGSSLVLVRYAQFPNDAETRGELFRYSWRAPMEPGEYQISLNVINPVVGIFGELGGQNVGSASGVDVLTIRVPAPATAAAISLSALLASRRRR